MKGTWTCPAQLWSFALEQVEQSNRLDLMSRNGLVNHEDSPTKTTPLRNSDVNNHCVTLQKHSSKLQKVVRYVGSAKLDSCVNDRLKV